MLLERLAEDRRQPPVDHAIVVREQRLRDVGLAVEDVPEDPADLDQGRVIQHGPERVAAVAEVGVDRLRPDLVEDLVRVAAHLGERRQPAGDLRVGDAVGQLEDVAEPRQSTPRRTPRPDQVPAFQRAGYVVGGPIFPPGGSTRPLRPPRGTAPVPRVSPPSPRSASDRLRRDLVEQRVRRASDLRVQPASQRPTSGSATPAGASSTLRTRASAVAISGRAPRPAAPPPRCGPAAGSRPASAGTSRSRRTRTTGGTPG